ncbi:hypothetical protein Hanom_Chr12g01109841 [Helianthus anomalus]
MIMNIYQSPCKILVSNLSQDIVTVLSTILTGISPIFPISVPFFLVLPFIFLLIARISFLLAKIVSVCKLQKIRLFIVGEYTEFKSWPLIYTRVWPGSHHQIVKYVSVFQHQILAIDLHTCMAGISSLSSQATLVFTLEPNPIYIGVS